MNDSRDVHYRFRHSTEELAARSSADMIARAAAETADLDRVNRAGAHKPTWELLDAHACPE